MSQDSAVKQAYEAIAGHVDGLGHELRATLDYFRTSTGGTEQLSRVLLTGRASELGGLAEALEARLGLPVERLSVLDRIHKPRKVMLLDEQETSLAVPAGLCLGSVAS